MALRFWFGASGAGKTTGVQEEMIARAMEHPELEFLMIVPDQFTMHTQKQLVLRHPDGGILNMDVLSFGRLSHRIFEEVGKPDRPLLDDTGKCLVLRKVMESCKEDIPLLAAGLRNPGFVQEVKSVISEFMQYDLSPEDVIKLSEFSVSNRPLALKLNELSILYAAFRDALANRFLTLEGTLELLCERMEYSELLKRSVVVFDGFTGFTPIQNRVIEKLLIYAKEVNVTLVLDHRYSPYRIDEATNLFALTQKTVYALQKLAIENQVKLGEDVLLQDIPVKRYAANPQMAHLERMLFRPETMPYEGREKNAAIEIIKAGTLMQESNLCCGRIFELIHERGYRYRDIAIVTADMNAYEEPLKKQFAKYGIPHFIDNTKSLMQNPFVAYLRSALAIVRNDFRYDDVFTFLRSGFAGFDCAMTDKLDNYVRAKGLRGFRMWKKPFMHPSEELRNREEELEALEQMRVALTEKFDSAIRLAAQEVQTAEEWCRILYEFCLRENAGEKLRTIADRFSRENDFVRAKEYEQIYRLVMELLEQLVSLIGSDRVSLKEFCELLDAGLAEIRVATLPQGVDILVVGDMERTRLKEIKALFFLGVNDGKIPADNRKGGLISDLEREYLAESGFELSETPSMQMFTQQLYLYMNLTKPEEYLWLSYASVSEDGTALAPAYLIKNVQELFPHIACQARENERPILSLQDRKDSFCELLQAYLNEELTLFPDKKELLLTLCADLAREDENWLNEAIGTAFTEYRPEMLDAEKVQKLYGEILNCSISSLERFAACQYAHYLSYALHLRERETFSFDALDMGNLSHEILQRFGEELRAGKVDWATAEEALTENILEKVTQQVLGTYEDSVFREEEKRSFYVGQIKRILRRTVKTLQTHLAAGKFVPYDYERKFRRIYDDILLKGKIDRVDVYKNGNETMVKIIDYKTGSRDFDFTGLYYGLSLQLAVYMKQVMEQIQATQPEQTVTPAAMLYYRISDPQITGDAVLSEEEMQKAVLESLNYKGLVCSREGVVAGLDEAFTETSLVVPVKRDRKTSVVKENAHVINSNVFRDILDYAQEKTLQLAHEIKEGKIACNPSVTGTQDACEYCPYRTSCGFDDKIPGYHKEVLPEVTPDAIRREGGEENEGSIYTKPETGH